MMSEDLMGPPLAAWWPVIPAGVAMAVVARAVWTVRGCTVVAPLLWALASLGIVATTALAKLAMVPGHGPQAGAGSDVPEFLAATSTFCPIVALLGAKRPQSKAWQLIVLSLWLVTALPALQSLLARPGEALAVHAMWRWFYAILVVVGGLNYMPSRFALAGLFVVAGQVCLLWNALPLVAGIGAAPSNIFGLLCLSAAVIVAGLSNLQRASRDRRDNWDRAWRDFRDAYGVVWALRIMERINGLAMADGIGVVLGWHGFSATDRPGELPSALSAAGQAEPEAMRRLEPALRQLLRRFVSARWIDARLLAASTATG